MVKDYTSLVDEVLENIRRDRNNAQALLNDVLIQMGAANKNNARPTDAHQYVGTVAAKYLEALTRSNDQFVKLLALNKPKAKGEIGAESASIEDEDIKNIFDKLQETEVQPKKIK